MALSVMDWAGWLVALGYVAGFFLLSGGVGRRGERVWLFDRSQALAAWGFRAGFVALLAWPVLPHAGPCPLPGLLLALAGAALGLWAQAHMGRSWRIGVQEGQTGALVQDGPFAWSRNPVFVGQLALAWGLALLAGFLPLAGAVMMTVSAIVQVRREEAALGGTPGYAAYAARVPRWIGFSPAGRR